MHCINLDLKENSTMLTPSEEKTSPVVIDDTINDGKSNMYFDLGQCFVQIPILFPCYTLFPVTEMIGYLEGKCLLQGRSTCRSECIFFIYRLR